MSITATIKRYCDLSWQQLFELKAWAFKGKAFPAKIAAAMDERGVTVAYIPIETCFAISEFIPNPELNNVSDTKIGNAIDLAVASEAQRMGVKKVLLLAPLAARRFLKGDFREVLVYEREVPQAFTWGVASDSAQPSYLS